MAKKRVYISGALTDVESILSVKKFYEGIGDTCKQLGLIPYIPHINTDPIINSDLKPSQVFKIDKLEVITSDLVIAYIGYPSLGVGMEIAYAEINNIPVILLYESCKTVSRFPRGIPNLYGEIQFDDFAEAIDKLEIILYKFISNT
jgi:hypothetical protein